MMQTGSGSPKNRGRHQTRDDLPSNGHFFEEEKLPQTAVDTSKLKHQSLPFKPTPHLKPAFDTHIEGSPRTKGAFLHKKFNYDLKQMFYEKGDSKKCYKSMAKWDLPFGREEDIQEMITK